MNEKILAKMIEAVNKHIAANTKSLEELLKDKDPKILSKDGNEYYIEKKELEFIASNVDEFEWKKFRIPIIFEMTEIGSERVVFVRDRMHAEFIKKTFGIDRFSNDALILYPHELVQIRRKLRTASQVMFRVML